MRLLARVRGEPLRLFGKVRVQVVFGVARGCARARRPARIGRPLTLFVHGHSFAATERTCARGLAVVVHSSSSRLPSPPDVSSGCRPWTCGAGPLASIAGRGGPQGRLSRRDECRRGPGQGAACLPTNLSAFLQPHSAETLLPRGSPLRVPASRPWGWPLVRRRLGDGKGRLVNSRIVERRSPGEFRLLRAPSGTHHHHHRVRCPRSCGPCYCW